MTAGHRTEARLTAPARSAERKLLTGGPLPGVITPPYPARSVKAARVTIPVDPLPDLATSGPLGTIPAALCYACPLPTLTNARHNSGSSS